MERAKGQNIVPKQALQRLSRTIDPAGTDVEVGRAGTVGLGELKYIVMETCSATRNRCSLLNGGCPEEKLMQYPCVGFGVEWERTSRFYIRNVRGRLLEVDFLCILILGR